MKTKKLYRRESWFLLALALIIIGICALIHLIPGI